MPSETALALLATAIESDRTYEPEKDAGSRRWHAQTAQGDFEVLTTGVKWYDIRAR